MNPDLSQLRDIHLPDAVSWWPPAIGWWVLALLLVLTELLIRWSYRRYKAGRWRKVALAELEAIRRQTDSVQQVKSISALLRRVAVTCYPRHEVAALTGEAWLKFLDGALKESRFQTQGNILISAPYTPIDIQTEIDVQPLFELSESWIKSVRRQA